LYSKQSEYKNKNSTTFAYSLEAIMKDNQSETVLSMIDSVDVCRCFEQQIERFLNIVNVPVAGEYNN